MMIRVSVLLAILAGTCFAQPESDGRSSPLKTRVQDFHQTGTFEEVLRQLAAQVRPDTLICFAKADGPDPKLTISVREATLGETLNQMFAQDHRYKVMEIHNPVILNVVPADDGARSMKLLKLRLQRFDMVTDDWPQNLPMRIPEFSPEILAYLGKWYTRESRVLEPPGAPGVTMSTNVAPPHTEIHMRNVTLLEVLNGISEWINALGSGKEGPVPKGVKIWPQGWKCDVPSPEQNSFNYWSHRIFSSFP